MLSFIGCCITIILVCTCVAKNLPYYFPRCYVDDPKISECILNATETLKPYIRKGIAEVNLPPFDPLITEFGLSQENAEVNYTGYFWNFTLPLYDNYEFKEIQYDPKTLVIHGAMEFKPVLTTSACKAKGRFIGGLVYFDGGGPLKMFFGTTHLNFTIKGEITKRKTKEYYNPTEVTVQMEIEDFDPDLSGMTFLNPFILNEILRIHSKRPIDSTTPALEMAVEAMWMRYLKWLTKRIPYNKLFPLSSNKLEDDYLLIN